MLKTSQTKATIGRIVHVYCPKPWNGPQPGIVVSDQNHGPATGDEPDPATQQTVHVNAMVSGDRTETLAYFRSKQTGNTFFGLSLFDPLSEQERVEAEQKFPRFADQPTSWCEWPPR